MIAEAHKACEAICNSSIRYQRGLWWEYARIVWTPEWTWGVYGVSYAAAAKRALRIPEMTTKTCKKL